MAQEEQEAPTGPVGQGRSRQGPTTATFNLPPELTRKGREAFKRDVNRYVRELTSELNRQAVESSKDDEPELTVEAVNRASEALAAKARLDGAAEGGESKHRAAMMALGNIQVTAGIAGIGALSAFLHSGWQIGAFAASVIVALSGLAFRWFFRTENDPRR